MRSHKMSSVSFRLSFPKLQVRILASGKQTLNLTFTYHGVVLPQEIDNFNYVKFKLLLGQYVLIHHIRGTSIWKAVIIVTGSGSVNLVQKQYFTITFFSEKNNFYVLIPNNCSFHFYIISFNRTQCKQQPERLRS